MRKREFFQLDTPPRLRGLQQPEDDVSLEDLDAIHEKYVQKCAEAREAMAKIDAIPATQRTAAWAQFQVELAIELAKNPPNPPMV